VIQSAKLLACITRTYFWKALQYDREHWFDCSKAVAR
jgi:hypothetical protein